MGPLHMFIFLKKPSPKFQIPNFKFKVNKMANRNDLCERLQKFAVDVILYLQTIKNTIETMDMKRQLVKSCTSSGANYEESQGSPYQT
jgi:hypothetical protein